MKAKVTLQLSLCEFSHTTAEPEQINTDQSANRRAAFGLKGTLA